MDKKVDKILLLCDKIAPYLLDMGEINQYNFVQDASIPGSGQEKNWVLYQLEADGYINRIATSGYDFALTYRGRMFILNNCYRGRHLVESAQEQNLKRQIESSIKANTSSVETNLSFKKLNNEVLPNNFKFQEKNATITLWFIALSTIIGLGGICTSILLSDKQIPIILQKQAKSIDSLKQSLQRIDISLQKIVNDTSQNKIK